MADAPENTPEQIARRIAARLQETTSADCVVVGWTYQKKRKSQVRWICLGPPLSGSALSVAMAEGLDCQVVGKPIANPDEDATASESPESPDTSPEE